MTPPRTDIDEAGRDEAVAQRAPFAPLEPPSWRHRVGYALGLLSVGLFVVAAVFIFKDLEMLIGEKTAQLSEHQFYAYVAGHACSMVACVWFLYQVLKAAERLMLPRYYIDQVIGREPTMLRALLGIDDPSSNLKVIGQAADIVNKVRGVGDAK